MASFTVVVLPWSTTSGLHYPVAVRRRCLTVYEGVQVYLRPIAIGDEPPAQDRVGTLHRPRMNEGYPRRRWIVAELSVAKTRAGEHFAERAKHFAALPGFPPLPIHPVQKVDTVIDDDSGMEVVIRIRRCYHATLYGYDYSLPMCEPT